MSNTEAVDRLLAQITEWGSETGATVEQAEIARMILVLGGSRALVVSERIMARAMTEDDWKAMYDAYEQVTRLIGVQFITASAPVITPEGQTKGLDDASS